LSWETQAGSNGFSTVALDEREGSMTGILWLCTVLISADLPPSVEAPLLKKHPLDGLTREIVSLNKASQVLVNSGEKVALVDLERGKVVWEKELSLRGMELLTVSEQAGVFLMSEHEGKHRIFVGSLKDGKQLHLLAGHTGLITGLALSSDGKRAVSSSHDETARVWNLETGRELLRYKGHAHPKARDPNTHVNGVAAFFPKHLAVTGEDDHHAYLWDLREGRVLFKLGPHERRAELAFFDSRGTTVYTTGMNDQVLVWDVKTGKQLGELKGHHGDVRSFFILPGDKRALSTETVTSDRILVWDLEARKLIGTIRTNNFGVRMDVSSDGKKLLLLAPEALEVRSLEKLPK
jgi:WD40 repeat protein